MSNKEKLGSVKYFNVTTHHPTGGFSLDADLVPRFGVFEQETAVAIYDGTMTKVGGFVGLYNGNVPISGSEGFEVNKYYNLVISGAVQGVESKFVRDMFQVLSNDADTINTKLTATSGDVVTIKAVNDQFIFSSSGVKADIVAVDGISATTGDLFNNPNVITNFVWDEVLTGATHNVSNSAGKRLRAIEEAFIIHAGTCDGIAGQTVGIVRLETATAPAIDNIFNHTRIVFTAGTNAGFTRMISDYDGTNKDITIAPDLPEICDATTEYEIEPAIVHAQTIAGGYEGGRVWVAHTGTVPTITPQQYVDGVIDNPLDDSEFNSGAAKTLADSLNLREFNFLPGSVIVLDQTYLDDELVGQRWFCHMNNQQIGDTLIMGAIVKGSGHANVAFEMRDCILKGMQIDNCSIFNSELNDEIILDSDGNTNNFSFDHCTSDVFGTGLPIINYGTGISEMATNVLLRDYSGGVLVRNMGIGNSNDLFSIDGKGLIIFLEDSCISGEVDIAGTFRLIDKSGPGVIVVQNARLDSNILYDTNITQVSGVAVKLADFKADTSLLARQDALLETSGNLLTVKTATDQLSFSSSGIKADMVALSGVQINISQFGGSSAADWSTAEKSQIRDSLGIDGAKINAVGGFMQAVSGDVVSIKTQTDQLVFLGSNVQASVTGISDVNVIEVVGSTVSTIEDFKADVSDVSITGITDVNIIEVAGTTISGTGNFQASLADLDIYHSDIRLQIDGSGGRDEYSVFWFKNASRILTGVTNQIIHTVKRSSGTSLIPPTAMTEIGSTHIFKHDESINRQLTGESYIVSVSGTIDGSTRTFTRLVGRDNTA